MEQSDEALILACRQGDQDAWNQLVERYHRLIYTIAQRAGLSSEQAADVMQRVFAILIEKLDDIQQPALIRSWLVTTTRFTARELARRERAVGSSLNSADEQDQNTWLIDSAALPEEQFLDLEQQRTVQEALNALDDRCRDLLRLLFANSAHPSYAEIAAMLNMREGSIGPMRARCLQKLRRILEEGER